MPALDKADFSGLDAEGKQAYVYARLLYPDLQKYQKTMPTEAAIRTVIAGLHEIMSLPDDTQELLATHLRLLTQK